MGSMTTTAKSNSSGRLTGVPEKILLKVPPRDSSLFYHEISENEKKLKRNFVLNF
jgi:hypothetical protein